MCSVLGIAACGGDDDDTNNTNNQPGPSLQQQAVDSGQISFQDGTGLAVLDTLAIDLSGTSVPAPSTPLPSGLETVDYYGAVDPAATTGWWEGWTYINPDVDGSLPGTLFHPLQAEIVDGTITPAAANACNTLNASFVDGGTVDIFGATFPVCVISGTVEADVSLPNNHVFVLDGTVTFGTGDAQLEGGTPASNMTLTIEPGTQIFGVGGNTRSALVISRGSQIDAQGTADQPVIMAAVDADTGAADVITGDPSDLTGRGEWGGLVLSGFGVENSGDANGELLTEAAPEDQERWFGGMDNSDSSGSVQYTIIAESGFEFRPDAEVQGLTLEAAGGGTDLGYIQIIGSEDDCVEWFGGAASIDHLICNGVDDDALDMDEGFVGNVQFAIVRMGTENGDRGIESDNNGDNFDQEPRTAPNLANITILGNAGKPGNDTYGALHREGFGGKVFRSVYTDDLLAGGAFEDGCVDVDDVLPASLQYRDVVFFCTPDPLVNDED